MKESHCRRATCSELRPILSRKAECLLNDHSRATGSFDAAQGLSDLFGIRLHDDDVQDFDTRWDQALLAAIEVAQVKITGFCAASHCIGCVRTRKRSK